MNFKLGRFFYLTISFIIGTFFFILGLFGIILPWSVLLQKAATYLILENTLLISLFGFGFVLTGLSLIIYTLFTTRQRYVHLSIGSKAVTLNETIIQQYLENYWIQHFPNTHVPYSLSIKKHSLQIVVDFPALSLNEQKIFLERLKDELNDLFSRVLGYPHDIHLIASFQSDKPLVQSKTENLKY